MGVARRDILWAAASWPRNPSGTPPGLVLNITVTRATTWNWRTSILKVVFDAGTAGPDRSVDHVQLAMVGDHRGASPMCGQYGKNQCAVRRNMWLTTNLRARLGKAREGMAQLVQGLEPNCVDELGHPPSASAPAAPSAACLPHPPASPEREDAPTRRALLRKRLRKDARKDSTPPQPRLDRRGSRQGDSRTAARGRARPRGPRRGLSALPIWRRQRGPPTRSSTFSEPQAGRWRRAGLILEGRRSGERPRAARCGRRSGVARLTTHSESTGIESTTQTSWKLHQPAREHARHPPRYLTAAPSPAGCEDEPDGAEERTTGDRDEDQHRERMDPSAAPSAIGSNVVLEHPVGEQRDHGHRDRRVGSLRTKRDQNGERTGTPRTQDQYDSGDEVHDGDRSGRGTPTKQGADADHDRVENRATIVTPAKVAPRRGEDAPVRIVWAGSGGQGDARSTS